MERKERKCRRCGAQFMYPGYGKALCPECMAKRRARQRQSAAQPRCSRCPQGLSLQRQADGIPYCAACERDDVERRRRNALDRFVDELIERGY